MSGDANPDEVIGSDEPEAGDVVQESWFANFFGFEEYGTDLRTEILAGITTFLTMSYIVVVNPAIMAGIPGSKPGLIID
jgi:AGZA family xanthine/uracil permease-like MFS transporter